MGLASAQTQAPSAKATEFAADYMPKRQGQMSGRYLTKAMYQELAAQLTDQDEAIVRRVCSLRFVSGGQLTRLHFGGDLASARAARRALVRLVGSRCLARLPRQVGGVRRGSSAFVYYLGPAGQHLAIDRGWTQLRRFRPESPGTLFVRHHLAVAELHTLLVEAERAGHIELLSLEAEPACHRPCGGFTLKPDSYVELGAGEFVDSYFIEIDRGTEGSRALDGQLQRYVSHYANGLEQRERGVFPKVFWLAPDAKRVAVIERCIARLPSRMQELFAAGLFGELMPQLTSAGTSGGLPTHEKMEVTEGRGI